MELKIIVQVKDINPNILDMNNSTKKRNKDNNILDNN